MQLLNISEWLDWIGSVHNSEIELGLDRVKKVAEKMDILTFEIPIITVGGTNGKGSTVAGLESIYRTAGYRVGTFTSPILFRHNEYVQINGNCATDQDFCNAYALIEQARGQISLTAFEYHTLAALFLFKTNELDVCILEVGLGGRLDAVNIIDPDVSVIASIGVDHVEWLGYTLEEISREKAGILRLNGYAVYGEDGSNHPLLREAQKIGTELIYLNKYYQYQLFDQHWEWSCSDICIDQLPYNALATQNMALVLMVIHLLQNKLPVTVEKIHNGLILTKLTGRIQHITGKVERILDVSHNPAAVGFLAKHLSGLTFSGKKIAVFSMLADKDIPSCLEMISDQFDAWFVAPLNVKRGASLEKLQQVFNNLGVENVSYFNAISDAYFSAMQVAVPGDLVVIFGSFYTVSAVYPLLDQVIAV